MPVRRTPPGDGAAPGAMAEDGAELLELPQTGTDAATRVRNGAILLLLAAAGLAMLRRTAPVRMTLASWRRAFARLLFLLLATCAGSP